MIRRMLGAGAVLALAAISLGCNTGGDCATLDTVWEGDAADYFASYCVSCHSTSATGGDRQNAPADINFDTYEDFSAVDLDEVEEAIRDGSMPPPDVAQPSEEENQRILDWLACGAPES